MGGSCVSGREAVVMVVAVCVTFGVSSMFRQQDRPEPLRAKQANLLEDSNTMARVQVKCVEYVRRAIEEEPPQQEFDVHLRVAHRQFEQGNLADGVQRLVEAISEHKARQAPGMPRVVSVGPGQDTVLVPDADAHPGRSSVLAQVEQRSDVQTTTSSSFTSSTSTTEPTANDGGDDDGGDDDGGDDDDDDGAAAVAAAATAADGDEDKSNDEAVGLVADDEPPTDDCIHEYDDDVPVAEGEGERRWLYDDRDVAAAVVLPALTLSSTDPEPDA
eukprot:m.117836 g.117836  ORF g.117836 m.117836 type:complete len:273 (+) comp16412_c7_seq2:414-1232(+)